MNKKWLQSSDQFYCNVCNIILNHDDDFDNDENEIINTKVDNKP